MTLEWIDPPRDHRDEAADLAARLRGNPGRWARIKTGISQISFGMGGDEMNEALESLGIETRFSITDGTPGTYGALGDLYARAHRED